MKLRITIENRIYEVEVEASDPEPSSRGSRPESRGFSSPVAPSLPVSEPAAEGQSRSPVAGVVVKVPAQVGQRLAKGETVVVLEAMKMETHITAPCDGVLKALLVQQGESVRSGQPLFEIE